jgi:hypothetical protein
MRARNSGHRAAARAGAMVPIGSRRHTAPLIWLHVSDRRSTVLCLRAPGRPEKAGMHQSLASRRRALRLRGRRSPPRRFVGLAPWGSSGHAQDDSQPLDGRGRGRRRRTPRLRGTARRARHARPHDRWHRRADRFHGGALHPQPALRRLRAPRRRAPDPGEATGARPDPVVRTSRHPEPAASPDAANLQLPAAGLAWAGKLPGREWVGLGGCQGADGWSARRVARVSGGC